MRTLFAVAAAGVAAGLIAALAAGGALGADTKATEKGSSEAPKPRTEWPRERVIVIGQRGDLRDWLAGNTFRGTEGFADGSAPPDIISRSEYPWQVYYAPSGKLEAHFRRLASRVPHGPIEELDFVEFGSWRIDEDGDLCQTIPRVGWGAEVCYWLDRRGRAMAMYYTKCGAYNRCYPGRLGPEGEIFPGRAFTR